MTSRYSCSQNRAAILFGRLLTRALRCAGVGVLLCASAAFADTGVLIPGDRQAPDPAVFSLNEMAVEIRVDNGTARVQVRQIFGNRTGKIEEGVYHFALPARGTVSDFAVWDDVTRIPGVILERRRAGEIYEQAKAQAIDPGLLQMGEHGPDEARRGQQFTAKIAPIPAWGTKRVEMEYQHPVAVEAFQSEVAVSLKSDAYAAMTAGHLAITLEIASEHAIRDFNAIAKRYPLQIKERTARSIKAEFFGSNIVLDEDFAVRWSLDPAQADKLAVITQRESTAEPGIFGARALLAMPRTAANAPQTARTVIVLFDNSLSNQWDKLERSFAACEGALRRLKPSDSFNLILFNSVIEPYSPQPKPATPDNIEAALAFIRGSRIRGGTDVQKALAAALAQTATGEPYLIFVGDGGATAGLIHNAKLAAWYTAEWNKLDAAKRPRTLVFGVGDDCNLTLLKMLAANNGYFEWVRSTEPVEFKLNAFLSKMGQQPLRNLTLTTSAPVDLVYPLEDLRFAGSMASWVGQYKAPAPNAQFTVQGTRDGQPVRMAVTAPLPATATSHPYLPRTWAQARVDALLDKIEREGEDTATIDEIIRLAKKYKFVTPYTSFLAAPRALLRPRVIRPGDPVLRVKTDASIVSVIALFPFGLTKQLRYLKQDDAWQTRFLAPPDLNDGTYQVRLILRDRTGHVYREQKSFVIASKTPVVQVKLNVARARAGETVKISAQAGASARTIMARMYGAAPVPLRWSDASRANTGELTVPDHLPPGRYAVRVTAEDIAHNIGTQEVSLEIW